MNPTEAALIITSIATLIGAVGTLGTLIVSLRNSRKIEKVAVATDGLTTKLVAATATASKAEGNLAGRAELKQEQKDT